MKMVIQELIIVIGCGAAVIVIGTILGLSACQIRNFIDKEHNDNDVPEWLGTAALVILIEALIYIGWWAFH